MVHLLTVMARHPCIRFHIIKHSHEIFCKVKFFNFATEMAQCIVGSEFPLPE